MKDKHFGTYRISVFEWKGLSVDWEVGYSLSGGMRATHESPAESPELDLGAMLITRVRDSGGNKIEIDQQRKKLLIKHIEGIMSTDCFYADVRQSAGESSEAEREADEENAWDEKMERMSDYLK